MVELIGSERSESAMKYKPFILAIAGLPFHGKTNLSDNLARNSNLVLLDVDDERARIFPEKVIGRILPQGQERFVMMTSYQSVHERARDAVQGGEPVVIAGAYTRKIYHQMLHHTAEKAGVPLKVIILACSEHEVMRRIQQRRNGHSLSNVRTFEQYLSVRDRY